MAVKSKLDSMKTKLDQLCSEEDGKGAVWDNNEDERRAKLFEWVARINSNSVALTHSQHPQTD